MAKASKILGGSMESSASERLAAQNTPSGKKGGSLLTARVKQEYAASDDLVKGVSYEEWLDKNGYAIGDNGLVYKK